MKNKNSVFTYSYRPRYYFCYPLCFLKETFNNFRAAWFRATKGWCYGDCWNMFDFLQSIIPEMLRHMADYGSAYPGGNIKGHDFSTPEKWHDWLHSVADVLESTTEENWDGQNEYEDDWDIICKEIRQAKIGENKYITTTYTFTDEEQKEIREKYWQREMELEQERQKLRDDALNQLITMWDTLWD